MMTEHINLTDKQAEFIRQNIEVGAYEDASEVVRAALRLLQDWQAQKLHAEAQLRTMLDDAEASGLSDRTPAEVWAAVEERYQNNRA